MPTNLEQRINSETAKIKAESYQKVASLGGWSGGGRTLWAISVVGAICGAGMGLIAPFTPLLALGMVGLPAALAALPTSLAVFTATGMGFGFGSGLMLGRISGATATVAQEQEKRIKEWTTRQLLSQNPNAEIIADAPPVPESKKSFGQRLRDGYRTYFNPRTGLVFGAIGAVGGLIMAAAFFATGGAGAFAIAPALGAVSGLGAEAFATSAAISANAPAILAYFTGVMAAFGGLFSVNLPKITSNTTHLFGEILSGRALGREWGPKKQPAQIHNSAELAYTQDSAIADGIIRESAAKNPSRPQYASFQELIAQQAAAADLGMKR